MSVELTIWIIISVAGLGVLPFVWRRRWREYCYHKRAGGNGPRREILRNRTFRAATLMAAVITASIIPLLFALFTAEERRPWSVAMIILTYLAIVTVLITDEIWSARIDRAERLKWRRPEPLE